MKLKHLLLTALMLVVGIGSSWAAPTDYLTGWTEVTSLPTNNAELSKYYYVFVEGDMMVGQDKVTVTGIETQDGQLTAMYMTPADPKTNNKLVWTLDYNATWEYGIRSLAHQGHYMQSRENWPWRLQAAWETSQSQWTHMVFAYADGTWTIQNKGWLKDTTKDYGENYWGAWYTDGTKYTNGYPLAGNKDNNNKGKFKIYSLPRCLYTDLTPGKDLTDCISNNSFELDWAGWTNTGMAIQNNTSFGKTGSKYAEKWEPNGTFGVERTINNLPAGLYKITVHSKARGVSSAYLYANDNQKQMTIADNEFDVEVYEKLNSEGSITIGAKAVGTGVGASWFCLDNFTLTYVGADFPEVETVSGLLYNKELETAQNTAKTAYEENKTVANYDALVAAVAAAKAEKDYENAQVARTTAALTNGTIATDVIDGWRSTNAQVLHVNTWSGEGATDGSDMTTPFIENWTNAGGLLGNGEVSYLMVGLTPGAKYSFSALGRAIIENKNETLHGITMFANEAEVDLTTQGTANYDGKNSLVYGTFTLTGTVNSDGVLAIGFKINETNCNWLSFKNVKFGELPTEEEKTAFTTAFNNSKDNVAGFQVGEYAPYANIDAFKALAVAKDVDVEHAMKAQIVNATTALNNAVWTANTQEVNAFYPLSNYNAESEKDGGNRYYALGWNKVNKDDATNTRIMVAPDASNAGLTSNALFAKYETSYGEQEGYTMPLKAGVYTLSFKHGGWGEPGARTISLTCGETTVTPSINTINSGYNDSQSNAEHWATYSCNITIPEAGDYVFNLIKTTNNQNQIVISDLELYTSKEVEANLQITSVGVATFCAPFDVNLNEVEGVEATAYEAMIADNSWVKLKEIESGVIEAGTPVVLKGTPMTEAKILKGEPIATVTKSSCLVGNLGTEKVEVVANAGNYLLQKNDGVLAWYQVKDAGLYIGVNRCYLEFSGDNAREFFPMDFDNPTGIDSIATEAKTKADGKYLVNGKIVVVKAGKVYEVK